MARSPPVRTKCGQRWQGWPRPHLATAGWPRWWLQPRCSIPCGCIHHARPCCGPGATTLGQLLKVNFLCISFPPGRSAVFFPRKGLCLELLHTSPRRWARSGRTLRRASRWQHEVRGCELKSGESNLTHLAGSSGVLPASACPPRCPPPGFIPHRAPGGGFCLPGGGCHCASACGGRGSRMPRRGVPTGRLGSPCRHLPLRFPGSGKGWDHWVRSCISLPGQAGQRHAIL